MGTRAEKRQLEEQAKIQKENIKKLKRTLTNLEKTEKDISDMVITENEEDLCSELLEQIACIHNIARLKISRQQVIHGTKKGTNANTRLIPRSFRR